MVNENSNISADYDVKPEPPREPELGECCQSGCDPCVYDRYWQAFERYEKALHDWEQRHDHANMRSGPAS